MAPTIAMANSIKSLATTHSKKQASRALTHLSLLLPLLITHNVAIIKISFGPHWPSSTIHSLGSTTRNVGKHSSRMMITSSRTKSFTQDCHQLQLHISLHASLPYPHSWPISSNHLTNYSSSLTPTITPGRVNGTLFVLLSRPALFYPHHASRMAASLWNSSPFITTTFGTMPSISVFGCNTMQPAILQPLPHTPQPTSSDLPILPRPMLSITVWFHSTAGSISHTATHSSTDLLTLPLFRLTKHATASAKLTGTSYPKINPSMSTRLHALTFLPTPFMLIGPFTLPISIHHVHNFLWRLRQIIPMASPRQQNVVVTQIQMPQQPLFFFLYKHPNHQPKGILTSRTKVKISVHP
jgi:hypothetical protein